MYNINEEISNGNTSEKQIAKPAAGPSKISTTLEAELEIPDISYSEGVEQDILNGQ